MNNDYIYGMNASDSYESRNLSDDNGKNLLRLAIAGASLQWFQNHEWSDVSAERLMMEILELTADKPAVVWRRKPQWIRLEIINSEQRGNSVRYELPNPVFNPIQDETYFLISGNTTYDEKYRHYVEEIIEIKFDANNSYHTIRADLGKIFKTRDQAEIFVSSLLTITKHGAYS